MIYFRLTEKELDVIIKAKEFFYSKMYKNGQFSPKWIFQGLSLELSHFYCYKQNGKEQEQNGSNEDEEKNSLQVRS